MGPRLNGGVSNSKALKVEAKLHGSIGAEDGSVQVCRFQKSGKQFMVHNPLFKTLIIALLIGVGFTGETFAGDRHAGYNYPEPQSEESYKSPVPPIPGVNRRSRISFIVGLDQIQKKNPYPPDYHMYAKGAESEKLIIVAVEEGRYNTLYRLRALLASMTSDARTSPLFAKIGHVERLGFYDLARMAGFKRITITNGKDIAHRVLIE